MPQSIYCCWFIKIKFGSEKEATCLAKDNKAFSEERSPPWQEIAMDYIVMILQLMFIVKQ